MRGAFSVEAPQGARWDLAVELLDRGEGIVSLRPLLIYRALGGPRPDERLRVEIVSSRARSQLTTAVAAADIAAGLRTLELVVGDERVAQLIKRHGIVREYVEDYETGRVRMATLAPDAAAIWDGAPPSA